MNENKVFKYFLEKYLTEYSNTKRAFKKVYWNALYKIDSILYTILSYMFIFLINFLLLPPFTGWLGHVA